VRVSKFLQVRRRVSGEGKVGGCGSENRGLLWGRGRCRVLLRLYPVSNELAMNMLAIEGRGSPLLSPRQYW
jgi:hypothetical protein